MNLKFESIIIDNFLSFEHAELNLDNNDFVLVSGKNLNIRTKRFPDFENLLNSLYF